jgi:DNA-binding transcriptional LysR family regulator
VPSKTVRPGRAVSYRPKRLVLLGIGRGAAFVREAAAIPGLPKERVIAVDPTEAEPADAEEAIHRASADRVSPETRPFLELLLDALGK